MSLPLLSLIVGPGVLVSRPGRSRTFFSLAEKPQAPAKTTACASEMSGQGGVDGRVGTVGDSRTDPSAVVDDGKGKVMRDLAGPRRVFM
jgi:hypothetical protein